MRVERVCVVCAVRVVRATREVHLCVERVERAVREALAVCLRVGVYDGQNVKFRPAPSQVTSHNSTCPYLFRCACCDEADCEDDGRVRDQLKRGCLLIP